MLIHLSFFPIGTAQDLIQNNIALLNSARAKLPDILCRRNSSQALLSIEQILANAILLIDPALIHRILRAWESIILIGICVLLTVFYVILFVAHLIKMP